MYFFFLLSPFHMTHVPWAKGILMSNWLANEETRNIPCWPRETGNLPAPASGSVIKAVFEMSQKMPPLSRILHLRVVGNINLPSVRNKKELTVILWKGLFTHANHASTVCITYTKIFNWTNGVLKLNASYLTQTVVAGWGSKPVILKIQKSLPDEKRGNHLGSIQSWS